MPPYRANPGGAFNSGLFPAPIARVDVGDAIRALGQSASSLLEATYIRKVAEQQRQARDAQQAADRARQAERDRVADEMARENLRLREETLRLQRERDQRAASRPAAPVRGTPEYEAILKREQEIRSSAPPRAATPTETSRDEERRAREAAEEAEGMAWLNANRNDPELGPSIAAALGVINTQNPALARSPGRAALMVRRALAADAQRENTEARTSASQASAARAASGAGAPPGVRLVRPGAAAPAAAPVAPRANVALPPGAPPPPAGVDPAEWLEYLRDTGQLPRGR